MTYGMSFKREILKKIKKINKREILSFSQEHHLLTRQHHIYKQPLFDSGHTLSPPAPRGEALWCEA